MHLEADAMTIAIAGTDTTAAALTAALWQLATHPKDVQKLREELDSIGFDAASPDHGKLGTLPHLRAVIDETLRLSPPAPSVGIGRTTPPEGMLIGSRFVPGGVDVAVPLYVVHHDARFFVDAEEFLPERWTTRRRELVREGFTYAPFSIGPYACVGKALAMAEMRLVVASVVSRFDVRPAEGMTGERYGEGQREMLTLMYKDVVVVFEERRKSVEGTF
jgi:cytochrome P450